MGCLKNFSIKTIQNHLKSKVSCQNFYSQTERDELKTQCDLYRKRKKTQYLVQYYKENKKVKRQPEEIETIIKIMKEIRESSFIQCLWVMADDLKSDVHILRKMKSYFRNQNHVEQDIEEFIHATFTYFNDEYDYEIKEIVWTMEFLLSNPSMSIDEEVKNLKSYLSSREWHYDSYNKIPFYKSQLFDLYFENLLKQLPEVTELNEGGSVRDYFEEIKIDNWSDKVLVKDYYEHEYDGLYYILDDAELENLPNNWLYPFLDPNLLHYDNFEDDFTSFLKTICRGCGKKFKNILQHLANPEVMCKKFYEKDEMEYLKHKSIVQKFTILLRDKNPTNYTDFLHGIIQQNFDAKGSTRLEVYRGKRDLSEFLAKHVVPDHLIKTHKQMMKNAIEIHDVLDEEISDVKFQVLDELGPIDTWASKNHYRDSQFIINMGKNLEIFIWNEKMKTALFLWDTLQDIAHEIGTKLEQTFSTNSYGHRHFDVEYIHKHLHILRKNRNRYETSKQGLMISFRKKEKWTGKLNFDTMIYHSDYSKSFKPNIKSIFS